MNARDIGTAIQTAVATLRRSHATILDDFFMSIDDISIRYTGHGYVTISINVVFQH